MRQFLIALCLTLPAAAQDSFQLEAETAGCFLPRENRILRWELHGGQYVCPDSKVVLSADQVERFRKELLALPIDEGAPDLDQFDPEVRREAYRKLTKEYGLRADLKDFAAGINARPSTLLEKSVRWFAGTEWKLSFSGTPALTMTASGADRPLPLLTLEQGQQKWDAFSYKALDFLRVLDGKSPGAELEFYLAGDKGRWQALKELQDQPQFSDWEDVFRIERVDSAAIPKYSLDLVPRHSSDIDRVSWQAQELDSRVCLSTYNESLAMVEGLSWLKQWKAASPGRRLELCIKQTYFDPRTWERAGLPGHWSHELELRGPNGQFAQVQIGKETDLCLVVYNSRWHAPRQHWLDSLRFKSNEVATISKDGKLTKVRLEQR